MGDFSAKIIMALTCLAPFRLLMAIITPRLNIEPAKG
jgi:hypothetical protein